MTYSDVIDALSNHMVPCDPLNPDEQNMIAAIEKFLANVPERSEDLNDSDAELV